MRLIDGDKMTADLLTVDPQYETMIQWCLTVLDAQPTIEERKRGMWIPQNHNKVNGMTSTAVYYYPKCSVCGYCAYPANFCPNCGADMRGDSDAN